MIIICGIGIYGVEIINSYKVGIRLSPKLFITIGMTIRTVKSHAYCIFFGCTANSAYSLYCFLQSSLVSTAFSSDFKKIIWQKSDQTPEELVKSISSQNVFSFSYLPS